MLDKNNIANKNIFLGLLTVAISILALAIYSGGFLEEGDSRILGVHTVPTPFPTMRPTAPTPFPTVRSDTGCLSDGSYTSNASDCCSGKAVYVFSVYKCGEINLPTLKPTPNKIIEKEVINNAIEVTPTLVKLTNCEPAVLETTCISNSGQNCHWYRDANCNWTCDRNCTEVKRCEPGNLGISCINNNGESCQKYQNSDCSIDCNQNCHSNQKSSMQSVKSPSTTVSRTFSALVNIVKVGSCKVGVDYNKDGVTNSMDIVACKSNTPIIVKAFSSVVDVVNTSLPLWLDWLTVKMGW